MARLSRAVVPDLPHHVTQRGNRRQQTFFCAQDYLLYLALMADSCDRFRVAIWAYCLMPNHVHLIAVPSTPDGLRLAIGEAHRRYTTEVNHREGWKGYLWQGRFASFAMDERHTVAAARYIELNPVRAALVEHPADYPWSSARAHISGGDDALLSASSLFARVGDWAQFLGCETSAEALDRYRRHERTGRPLGSDDFVDLVETRLNRAVRPRRPGPPPAGASGWHGELRIVSPNLRG